MKHLGACSYRKLIQNGGVTWSVLFLLDDRNFSPLTIIYLLNRTGGGGHNNMMYIFIHLRLRFLLRNVRETSSLICVIAAVNIPSLNSLFFLSFSLSLIKKIKAQKKKTQTLTPETPSMSAQ